MPRPPDGSDSVRAGSLIADATDVSHSNEIFDGLVKSPGARIERIVSTGQATPEGTWYDQEWDEFVLLVSGAARLRVEGEKDDRELFPGDWVVLPAHCRHRVTWTQGLPPTIWLAVHFDAAPAGPGEEE